MKVLVACECSGLVRDAFIAKGHNAVSCDLLPSERPGPHYQGDVLDLFRKYCGISEFWFDIVIAFPPCTHLAVSGARWFKDKQQEQMAAIEFFYVFTHLPYQKVAIENPVGIMSTKYKKPDQIIQPWQFGHGETKATCLWLKGLPKLIPTNIVEGREHRIHRMAPSPERSKERSRTFTGIADAMAQQWGI
jgi:site-specific DNA-cytosine methylase